MLAFIQGQKLSLHRFAQLAEIPSDQRPAHGYENVRTGLDEHPFIHGHENFPFGCCLVGQNPGASAATQSSR